MTLQTVVVLLVGLSLAAAEEGVSAAGSYTAPEPATPQYQPAAVAPEYSAPTPPQPPPMVQYIQSHNGYDTPSYGPKPMVFKGGNSFLSKFGFDWIFTGVMVASMVVLLAIVGVVTVPSLPFTSDILPSVTGLFKARHLETARSLAGSLLDSGLLGDLPSNDVANAVNFVETAIERARRFIADYPQ